MTLNFRCLADSSTKTPGILNYRPDIDGIRGIAIILVVLFHSFGKIFKGGFIGVDIFFVISGYLITTIIINDIGNHSQRKFSIAEFYSKRIRRIFPALIVVMAAVFCAGWVILTPREFINLGKNIAGGAVFASNFVLLSETGYFATAAEKNPLLHLWSLAVEEQFYIAWPILLITTARAKGNIIYILLAASFISSLILTREYPDATFYLPFTRAWELLAGGLLAKITIDSGRISPASTGQKINYKPAQIVYKWAEKYNTTIHNICSFSGLALITIAATSFDQTTPFPGWRALLPVTGTFLILSAKNSCLNRLVLARPPLVFIGLISYPLYLWHWPILAFVRIYMNEPLRWYSAAPSVIVSSILAWMTYRYIEKPIRFSKIRRSVVFGLCAGMIAICCAGLAVIEGNGFKFRFPEAVRDIIDAQTRLEEWRHRRCFIHQDQDGSNFAQECSGAARRPLIFLWGDSHAAALYPGLNHMAESRGTAVAQFTAGACPPILSHEQSHRPTCKKTNEYIFEKIKQLQPEIVLLHSLWNYDLTMMEQTISTLKTLKVGKIVLLGPVPRWGKSGLPKNVLDYYKQNGQLIPQKTDFRLQWKIKELDDQMRATAENLDIDYISAWDALCDKEGCLARAGADDRDITAFDYGHLSVAGSEILADRIASRLLPDNFTPGSRPQQQRDDAPVGGDR